MDIASLNAFVAIADTASFSLAADKLHLTQPAVSKRIQTLETELNVRLFDRIGRRVLLTEAGHTLLPRARRILAEVEDGQRALSNLSGQVSGTLTIATSHHIGLHRLPPVLREFAARYPAVRLDMRFMDSEFACQAIARGEAEVGIVTLPPVALPPLQAQPLWDDPLTVVVHRAHPLASQVQVTAAELAPYPAILPAEITFTRAIIDRYFSERGITLNLAFATNYLETIKMMVSVGLGWSILPCSMLDGGLAAVTLHGFALRRTLGTVLHADQTQSNAGRAMLAILAQSAVVGP